MSNWPPERSPRLLGKKDTVLRADGALTREYDDIERQIRTHTSELTADISVQGSSPTSLSSLLSGSPQTVDSPLEIEIRRQRLSTTNTDEAKLNYLELCAFRAIEENERRGPQLLAPQVRDLRRHVDELLQGRQHPSQRQRLYAVGVHLSGLLGALALDLGQWKSARAYGQEAFDLASFLQEPGLQSWARATQSLIAYYSGDHHDALAYARNGQQLADGGVQSVRLAINGEARALARLGDTYGVDEAVDRGMRILDQLPAAAGVSPSLSLDVYCHARAAANAATAYLALRDGDKVRPYATQALQAFDEAGLRGPQALSRLDLASSHLLAGAVDPDAACDLVREAMRVARDERFESVAQRAEEFTRVARPWASQPSVKDVTELVRGHRSRPALKRRTSGLLPCSA